MSSHRSAWNGTSSQLVTPPTPCTPLDSRSPSTRRQLGYDVIAEFSCRGFDTWGPLWLTGGLNKKHPDERDIQRAGEFAERLGRWLGKDA